MQPAKSSGASGSPSAKVSNQACPRAVRAARSGRFRSFLLTTPGTGPSLSMTGTALIRLSNINRAISRVDVSGCTDTTDLVMYRVHFIRRSSNLSWRPAARQGDRVLRAGRPSPSDHSLGSRDMIFDVTLRLRRSAFKRGKQGVPLIKINSAGVSCAADTEMLAAPGPTAHTARSQ
jgi:hypothetical protein